MTLSVRVVAIGLWLAVCVVVPQLVLSLLAAPGASRTLHTPAMAAVDGLSHPSQGQTEEVPQRLDIRGNEIASPVARYQVDRRGTLYEVHSPNTEVPRLKEPTL